MSSETPELFDRLPMPVGKDARRFVSSPAVGPSDGRSRDDEVPASADLVAVAGLGGRRIVLDRLVLAAWRALVASARADNLGAPLLLPILGYHDLRIETQLGNGQRATSDSSDITRQEVAPTTPGTHQSGRALDLYLGGKLTGTLRGPEIARLRSLPAHKWLTANAERFGFYPHPTEPWHWVYNPPHRRAGGTNSAEVNVASRAEEAPRERAQHTYRRRRVTQGELDQAARRRRLRPSPPEPAATPRPTEAGPAEPTISATTRAEFEDAVRNEDWGKALHTLDGLGRSETMGALEAMRDADSVRLWSEHTSHASRKNAAWIQFARDVVVRRMLPADEKSHRAADEIAAAVAFLRDRAAGDVAFDIAGVFEGGRASLNNLDTGVISYGKHHATLASGSLARVLARFAALTSTDTGRKATTYLDRAYAKDETLRNDLEFLQLLKDTVRERAMARAQDDVATLEYWKPACNQAAADHVTSALGLAIYYDTMIHGGLLSISERTKQRLSREAASEPEFLEAFLAERRHYLLRVAVEKRAAGDEGTARALEQSASPQGRVGILLTLLATGDFALRGGQNEKVPVGGAQVYGARATVRRIFQLLDPHPSFGQTPDFQAVFQLLTGLRMEPLLRALHLLKRAGYLNRLRENLTVAANDGGSVTRLDLAMHAVERRGSVTPEDFDRRIRVVRSPNLSAADRTELLRFLKSSDAGTSALPH